MDNLPELKIIVTGSSSFDLANKISEPLTGRIWNYHLYPIATVELSTIYNNFELDSLLENQLIFGSYPDIFSQNNNQLKKEYLENLSNSYLYKDLLNIADIRNSNKIRDILKLLAFQIGSEVSLTELGNSLDINKDTVNRYLDLLEKAFIITPLSGYSRNLRKEVTKMRKFYFNDLGIRNILIDNLKPLKDRDDIGKLWENYLFIERTKLQKYSQTLYSPYFWRTYTGAEIDYIEDREGSLHGYEFKFNSKLPQGPTTWSATYPSSTFTPINKDNYLSFILKQ